MNDSSIPEMTNTVEDAVKKLQGFMAAYDKQPNYKDYTPGIYLNDILYGLGISMNPNYRNANGFRDFKRDLVEHLKREIGDA